MENILLLKNNLLRQHIAIPSHSQLHVRLCWVESWRLGIHSFQKVPPGGFGHDPDVSLHWIFPRIHFGLQVSSWLLNQGVWPLVTQLQLALLSIFFCLFEDLRDKFPSSSGLFSVAFSWGSYLVSYPHGGSLWVFQAGLRTFYPLWMKRCVRLCSNWMPPPLPHCNQHRPVLGSIPDHLNFCFK